MTSGPHKGAAFERKICKLLSLWVTGGKQSDLFWRSAMSGGRATVMNRRGGGVTVRQAGDICTVAPEGHVLTDRFYFECKHRRSIGFVDFVLHGSGPLAEWWGKACQEAFRYGREPVLLVRGNRMPIIVITKGASLLNRHPVITLRGCSIGLFTRTLRSKFR